MDLNNIKIQSNHPVAFDSLDHIYPWGTARDNSRNINFNKKIFKIYNKQHPVKILDLGCSGGGAVEDFIEYGALAIGLEGSNYSKILQRAAWSKLSDRFLFTCDITKEFIIEISGNTLLFDCITSWDVLEHLNENELEQLIHNIKNHSQEHSLIILSISTADDLINGINFHRTVKPESWWVELFRDKGLYRLKEFEKYFSNQYIRGKRYGAENSFNIVLSQNPKLAPNIPYKTRYEMLIDLFAGTKYQKFLNSIVTGQSL